MASLVCVTRMERVIGVLVDGDEERIWVRPERLLRPISMVDVIVLKKKQQQINEILHMSASYLYL